MQIENRLRYRRALRVQQICAGTFWMPWRRQLEKGMHPSRLHFTVGNAGQGPFGPACVSDGHQARLSVAERAIKSVLLICLGCVEFDAETMLSWVRESCNCDQSVTRN
jgi:hypothetical protein